MITVSLSKKRKNKRKEGRKEGRERKRRRKKMKRLLLIMCLLKVSPNRLKCTKQKEHTYNCPPLKPQVRKCPERIGNIGP